MALNIGIDAGWCGSSGGKNCGSAAGEREVAGVAETVREKKAGDTEAAVAFVDFEDGAGVVVRADHHVVMKMDAAFWDTSGTGRIKPEGGVISRGRLGSEVRGRRFHQPAQARVVRWVIRSIGH